MIQIDKFKDVFINNATKNQPNNVIKLSINILNFKLLTANNNPSDKTVWNSLRY
jgi:hypothetical protein